MPEVQAPHSHEGLAGRRIFLAGSIEMGRAAPWQAELVEALADAQDLVLLNPRRDDWDSSWRQSIDDPRFREQVEWELAGLEAADVVVMVLLPDTQAPISLLELGLVVGKKSMVLYCPEGYWRRGNVDVVLARYASGAVHRADTLADLPGLIRRAVAELAPP